MTTPAPAVYIGLDVGKSSHWACLIDRDGEVLASAPVRNREAELDALFASAPAGTLVVVDQFRNIGSLAVRRARAARSPPATTRSLRVIPIDAAVGASTRRFLSAPGNVGSGGRVRGGGRGSRTPILSATPNRNLLNENGKSRRAMGRAAGSSPRCRSRCR